MAIKFIYTPIRDDNKSQLQIKNKAEKKYYTIDYFANSDFKKKAKKERELYLSNGEAVSTGNIIGYTDFKQACDKDGELPKFIAANNEYIILEKKKFFRKVTGYICVTEESDVLEYSAELGATKANAEAMPKYIAVTRFTILPLLPFLLLLLLLLGIICGMKNCQREPSVVEPIAPMQTEQAAESTTSTPRIDDTAVPWNGELPQDSPEQDEAYIDVPGYTDIRVNSKYPTITLLNPAGNTVYFKYIINSFDGTEPLYKTELIPEGMCVEWDAKSVLAPGQYNLSVKILTYDVETGYPCTPIFTKIPVTVE